MASTKPLRNIMIMSCGSRGDVQPYIALAIGLKKAGYIVSIMTNENHKAFVEEMGLKCLCIFVDCDMVIKTNKDIGESMAKGDTMKFIAGLNEAMDQYKELQTQRWKKCMEEEKPDLLVEGSLCDFWGVVAKYRLKIPVVVIRPFIMMYDPRRMSLGLPTLPFGLHKYLLWNVVLGGMYDGWKSPDEELKKQFGFAVLDVYSKNDMIQECAISPGEPHYVMQSPQIESITYGESKHPNFQLLGTCVIGSESQQQAPGNFGTNGEIEKFLKAGSKPVYCGWGSMTCKSTEVMVELVARALMLSGQRGIVLGGWAQLSMEALRKATQDAAVLAYAEKNVLFVEKAAHEWLFPQVACTVHHGGAGTTAAGMRAGVPTIVTPVFLDQWDTAHLVTELGAGFGFTKQLQLTSAEELGSTIKAVVENPEMAAKAKDLGAKMRAEDGVKVGVQKVGEFWKEWVQTGILSANVERTLRGSPGLWSCCSASREKEEAGELLDAENLK